MSVILISRFTPNSLQLLCLIGEGFDDAGEQVCGAVINIRPKGDKLALWTAEATCQDSNIKIGYAILPYI